MKMKKMSETSPLVEAIGKMGKSFLHVSAHVDHGGMGMMEDDMSWRKKELERLRKEIKATQKEIAGWNAETVAAQALKSLKSDLAVKKARLMETEAMLNINEEEGEDKKEEKKEA